MNRIKSAAQVIQNMGFRYLVFRVYHLISIKTGLFKRKFPVEPPFVDTIPLNEWKNNLPPFFFYGRNIKDLQKLKSVRLEDSFEDYSKGVFSFFGKSKYHLGIDYDWVTNPVSEYKYDITQHWSMISDYSEKNGDIKFVWEKARFTFLLDLIRYDFHYDKDCAEAVFNEIVSFIDKNPVNRGPNYICSQETSLRIINWTFALYYYKDSDFLTEALFRKIMNAIYWQIHHVFHNIHFSRISVRNNHAITETLLLYLSGLLFPFLPDVKEWSRKGKKWFEQEIDYQIYKDGTYLQFSNNYHRVVVQLLTLGIRMAELNNDRFNPGVYIKAKKSLDFLYNSMDKTTGMLPNYGSNDGALFFKMNDCDFRDFRPQLQALSSALGVRNEYDFYNFEGEDLYWLGFQPEILPIKPKEPKKGTFSYPDGGFYLIRDNDSLTFIRCGNHKDRPAQADNLHLDIWYKGINVFRDNGSFKYNAEQKFIKFFMGTDSHNTIMLDNFDQMLKGPRFIWFDWSQALYADLQQHNDSFEFEGAISAFRYLGKGIEHRRKIIKTKDQPLWIIEDEITGTDKFQVNQLWHFNPEAEKFIRIEAKDSKGESLSLQVNDGWYSSYYGSKEESKYWVFSTSGRKIITEIELLTKQ